METKIFGLRKINPSVKIEEIAGYGFFGEKYVFDEKDWIVGRSYTRFYDGEPEGDMILYHYSKSELKFVVAYNEGIDVRILSIQSYVGETVVHGALPKPSAWPTLEIVPTAKSGNHKFTQVEMNFKKAFDKNKEE